jgi:1-acyl-sn-glycerol-3-phosphate acyltransferase
MQPQRPASLRKRVWVVTTFLRGILMTAAVMRIFFRVKVIGRTPTNPPRQGALVLCPNHPSSWDPILLFGAARRNVAFFAKDSLFHKPVLGWILRWMGTIPVARGTSRAIESTDQGVTVLRHDGMVVNFYQGGTSLDLWKIKTGPAYMLYEAGGVVVPVGIVGTNGWWYPFKRVVINFGQPIAVPALGGPSTSEERHALMRVVVTEVARLVAEGQAYLGRS